MAQKLSREELTNLMETATAERSQNIDTTLSNSQITKVYFVRHAQPEHMWEDDRTRPLTTEGTQDTKIVLDFLKDKAIDVFYSSPYKRSFDTIADTAEFFGKKILTDERLRKQEKRV